MKNLLKIVLLSAVCLLSTSDLQSQEKNNWNLGPEIQIYPTGILPGLRIEKGITSSSSINLRVALQLIDHRDLGVHDNEEGNGYGLSLGYRKFLDISNSGFSLSLRADYWKNRIDWVDQNPINSGTSEITVLQPTVLLEYIMPNNNSLSITPSLGFGYEWNIKTVGAPTGQGAILLLGVFIGFEL